MERLAVVAAFAAALLPAETPTRPRILGISHVAFRVSDVAAARSFYEDFLGFRGVATNSAPAGAAEPTLIVVNARQYLELVPGLAPDEDRLHHIALETDDAAAMRLYLAARGVAVPPRVALGRARSRSFTVPDPEGHVVELDQFSRPGQSGQRGAEPPGAAPISGRILHLGILVGDLPPAMSFYGGALGFPEIWRGSRSGTELSWINMKVPDGGDYVEFMLYGERPAPAARGTQHHVCLEVEDVERARASLEARPYRASYRRPLEVRVGTNRKRQLNLYDPDGTRVELMEPQTVDGRPAPSSTAPPPRRP